MKPTEIVKEVFHTYYTKPIYILQICALRRDEIMDKDVNGEECVFEDSKKIMEILTGCIGEL